MDRLSTPHSMGMFPVAAILAGAAPIATAILFGRGWGLAAAIAPLVAIQYGIYAVERALASALSRSANFACGSGRLLLPSR